MLGFELGEMALKYLGFTGGTLVLLTLAATGLSLFTGVSWVGAAERMGLWLEEGWHFIENKWKEWQDRKVGREVAEKREAVVSTKRKKTEQSPPAPVRIEPAVTEVPKSERVERERQQALFADMSED